MPEVAQYLQGFGLSEGTVVAGYTLRKINVSHNALVRYHKYQYPTEMIWEGPEAGYNQFVSALTSKLSVSQGIRTNYGNLYRCDFGALSFSGPGSTVHVNATGICSR